MVGSIAGAIEKVAELFTPVVERAIIEKTDKAHARRVQESQRAFHKLLDDNPDNNAEYGDLLLRYFEEAGHPIGSMGGRTIRIPLELANEIPIILSENIRGQEIESQLRYKA